MSENEILQYQREAKTDCDEHAAVLLQAPKDAQVTHTGDDGSSDHQSVGGVDGPECRDQRGEL